MTRKHFVAIANILHELQADEDMIQAFVSYLYTQNAHFDSERFRDYVKTGGKK